MQHLIQQTERSTEELYKRKDFYKQKWVGTKKLYWAKKWVSYCMVTFLHGVQGSIRQINKLLLTSQFLINWFTIPFLGEAKTVIKLFWFGDLGLSISASIWACCLVFNNVNVDGKLGWYDKQKWANTIEYKSSIKSNLKSQDI